MARRKKARRSSSKRLKTKSGRCLVISMKCGKGLRKKIPGGGFIRAAPLCSVRVGGRTYKRLSRPQADNKLRAVASAQRATGCSGPKINLKSLAGYRRRRSR